LGCVHAAFDPHWKRDEFLVRKPEAAHQPAPRHNDHNRYCCGAPGVAVSGPVPILQHR
tara:strand:+ start:37185 stop:37358 length:174 start_codon:yes stop_codon:yes gene_type:complete